MEVCRFTSYPGFEGSKEKNENKFLYTSSNFNPEQNVTIFSFTFIVLRVTKACQKSMDQIIPKSGLFMYNPRKL